AHTCCHASHLFFSATATTELSTLSLHDALPIYADRAEHRLVCTCCPGAQLLQERLGCLSQQFPTGEEEIAVAFQFPQRRIGGNPLRSEHPRMPGLHLRKVLLRTAVAYLQFALRGEETEIGGCVPLRAVVAVVQQWLREDVVDLQR